MHMEVALGPAGVLQLKAALGTADAVLGNYLPHDTYLVFAPRSSVAALHALPGELGVDRGLALLDLMC